MKGSSLSRRIRAALLAAAVFAAVIPFKADVNIYAEEDKDRMTPVGAQIQFAGVFPADSPRYTICVVADKQSTDVSTSVLQDVVNPLTKWLLKN